MVKVLFVDNHLLVLHKPAGLLTQPNDTQDPSLESLGKGWIKKEYHKPGSVFLNPVHRIDRPVSGIVLFARTSKALSRLNSSLRAQQFEKKYVALASGIFPEKAGFLEHKLEKGEYHCFPSDNGKICQLNYQVLQSASGNSLLSITLLTGRYHQIRAQLAAIGHPLIGDPKYGGPPSPHLYLHHTSLRFPHPISGEPLHIHDPLPPYWPSR